jgi:hypothetical protein
VAVQGAERSESTLVRILWRSIDRFPERPPLVDALEFADRVARSFAAFVAEEEFAGRFFARAEAWHRPPQSVADIAVPAPSGRLHVYEFDLDGLEYVIVEGEDELVVVSAAGQFEIAAAEPVARALATPARSVGSGPRAYFVRRSGEVVAVDVAKTSRVLQDVALSHGPVPAIDGPTRLRQHLSAARERRAVVEESALAALSSSAVVETRASRGSPGGPVFAVDVGGTLAVVAEAFALAKKSGIDAEKMREALLGGFAASRVLEVHGERILKGNFKPGFKTRLFAKDLKIASLTLGEYQVAGPITAVAQQEINARMAAGAAEEDYSGMAKVVLELARLD